MLSILPFDRLTQRDTTRPFKAYPHTSSALPSYPYPTFPSSFPYSKLSSEGMDLRPDMYDQSHMMDLAHHGGGHMRAPIKTDPEDMSTHHPSYSMAAAMMNTHAHGGYYSNGNMGGMVGSMAPSAPSSSLPPPLPMPPAASTSPEMQHASSSMSPTATVTSSSPNQDHHHDPTGAAETPGIEPPLKGLTKKRALSVPEELKDNMYWDKRKKNNDSAKRSREARRMKEEQIAMRVVYLEQENLQLRTEVSLLKSEIEKLRCMLYNS